MVAVPDRPRLQRRRVGAGAGLGQAIAGDALHGDEAGQIGIAHRLVAIGIDHPRRHVVNRDEGAGRRAAMGHRLHDQRRLQPPQPDAARFLAHIDRAKAEFGGRLDGIDGENMLLVPLAGERRDAIGGETPRHFLDGTLVVGQVELHRTVSCHIWRRLAVGHKVTRSQGHTGAWGHDCSSVSGDQRLHALSVDDIEQPHRRSARFAMPRLPLRDGAAADIQ